MKITELIKKLEEVKNINGDLDVNCGNSNYVEDLNENNFSSIFSIEHYTIAKDGNTKDIVELEIRTD